MAAPEPPDGRTLVRELARTSGAKTRRIDMDVGGVGLGFDLEAKIARRGKAVSVASNGSWLWLEHRRESPFAISLGEPDVILNADQLVGTVDELFLYMPRWADAPDRSAAVAWVQERAEALRRVRLTPPEHVLIAGNNIHAALRPTLLGRLIDRLDALLDLAEAGPPAPPQRTGVEDIYPMPAGLEDLADLARTWAVSDDVDRDELIEAAPDGALEDLYRRLEPHFAQINELLDAASDPSEDLLNAGTLAEAATEARLELEDRNRGNQ